MKGKAMEGVHYNEVTKRWRATGYFNKKQELLYEGKSEELAQKARRKYNLDRAPTKPCLDCSKPVVNRRSVKRCRACAGKHKKSCIDQHNARRRRITKLHFSFNAHNHWRANKGNALADCFYEV
jgi:hypothetical protein